VFCAVQDNRLVEQEMLTFPECMNSHPAFSGSVLCNL